MLTLAIIVLVVLSALFFSSKHRESITQAVPMGAYLNAIKQGASVEAAIFDAVQVLRYRTPWRTLTDDELMNAAKIFSDLKDPSLFTQVVATVERTRDLSHFRRLDVLKEFVAYANART